MDVREVEPRKIVWPEAASCAVTLRRDRDPGGNDEDPAPTQAIQKENNETQTEAMAT